MTEIKTYCDHCGKVLNDMHDYADTEIGFIDFAKADLCAKCIRELDTIVKQYCGKGDTNAVD